MKAGPLRGLRGSRPQTRIAVAKTPAWCTGASRTSIKGFSDLEVAYLVEEIVDDCCYLPPGLIQLSPGETRAVDHDPGTCEH
jgi:hypothetical protein